MIKYLSLCLFFLAFTHRSLANDDENQRYLRHKKSSSRQSIAATASAKENQPVFSTLVSVLGATGLDRALDCRAWSSRWCTKYTVFAPTNAAFAALADADSKFFKTLTEEPDYEEHLKQLLLHHVVDGNIKAKDITTGPVESKAGEILELEKGADFINVKGRNEANVIDPFDIKTNNGRIHTIDSVLLPSFITDDIPTIASSNPDFSILVEALVKAGLVDALRGGPFTVLAPTNAAFEKLGINLDDVDPADLADILKYHVIEGIALKSELADGRVPTLLEEDIRVSVEKKRKGCDIELNGSAKVIATDVLARNGVIHVIDEVLIPPSSAARANMLPSIVEVVQSDPNFSILLGAVSKFEGIVEAFSNSGTFTVFAPTDQAFEDLGLETVNGLSDEELEAILTYHVLTFIAFSTDLPDSALVNTLNGKGIDIDARKGVQLNGNTHVIDADIEVSNGVIHVIDKVLIPTPDLVEVLAADGRFTALVDAVKKAGLVETLKTTSPLTIFAPTDEAFGELIKEIGQEAFESLDAVALGNILKYHVVGQYVPVQSLERSLPTLAVPETISVSVRRYRYWWWHWRTYLSVVLNGNVHVEDADILASNGVIHAIDGVLLA